MKVGSGNFVYEYVDDWPKVPDDIKLGWVAAVAVDALDNVYVYSRSEIPMVIFDREGNFASDELHVVERWTPLSPYHMKYEATIEDPNVFTRPWKMSFILYKHVEENAELKEFNCVPIVEPMFYKPLGFYDEEIPNNP